MGTVETSWRFERWVDSERGRLSSTNCSDPLAAAIPFAASQSS